MWFTLSSTKLPCITSHGKNKGSIQYVIFIVAMELLILSVLLFASETT